MAEHRAQDERAAGFETAKPGTAAPWLSTDDWPTDYDVTFRGALTSHASVNGMKRGVGWYFWKFVHNALIHPWLALPWEPQWAQRAHDWTAKRCEGGG